MLSGDRGVRGNGKKAYLRTVVGRLLIFFVALTIVTASLPVGQVVAAEQKEQYTVSKETKQVIQQYLEDGEGAWVQYPYEYNGEKYIVVAADPRLDGIIEKRSYYPDEFTEESFTEHITRAFVIRIGEDPQLVPRTERETIRAVLEGRSVADTLYGLTPDPHYKPPQWFLDYESDTLDGPVSDGVYAAQKAGGLLKSDKQRYLAALNAMAVTSTDIALIPDEMEKRLKSASSASKSAATATEIISEISDQKYVEVAGEKVDSKLVQIVLRRYKSEITNLASGLEKSGEYTDKITFAASLVDIVLGVLEQKVYAEERVDALVDVKQYAERREDVTMDPDLKAAIETVRKQHEEGTDVSTKLVRAIEENKIDLATAAAPKVAKTLGKFLASRSGTVGKVSSLLLSSSSTTIIAGVLSKANLGLTAYQLGGMLVGKSGIYMNMIRARHVRYARQEFRKVGKHIEGRFEGTDATVAHHRDAEVLRSSRYLAELSLATYYEQHRKTMNRFTFYSVFNGYEDVKHELFGEDYTNEKKMAKEFAADERKDAREALRVPVQPVLNRYPEQTDAEPLSSPTRSGPTGTLDATQTVTLDWTSVGDDGGVTYDVYLEGGTDQPDELVAQDISGTQTTVSVDPGTSYSWKVVAESADGKRQSRSTVGYFSVSPEEEPSGPFSAKGPSDGQTDVGLGTTLRWNAPEPDRYAENYVYLDTDRTPQDGELLRSTRGESLDVDDLEPGTTYYWQVVVVDDGRRTAGPVWSFTTAPQSGSLSVSGVGLAEGEELVVDGATGHDETERVDLSYYLTAEEIDSESGGEFDVRVIDMQSGIVLGTDDSNTDSEGDRFEIELSLHEDALFKRPGSYDLKLIAKHHGSGEKVTEIVTVDVTLDAESGELVVLPERPTTSDEVTLDASRIDADTYDWLVFHEETEEVEVYEQTSSAEVSFSGRDEQPDDPYESYEYTLRDGDGSTLTDGEFGIVDEEDFYEPDMTVGDLSVPEKVVEGNPVTASVTLSNNGRAEAHYVVRWKVDGETVSSAADSVIRRDDVNEDPHEDTESEQFSLRPGVHTITVVVIDSRGEKHELTRRVTVEENHAPSLSSLSPADDSSTSLSDLVLSWSGTDQDGDDVTYTVTLEAGDETPDEQVVSGLDDTTFDPSGLESDTTYYWQVTATDEHGRTTTSSVRTFDTGVNEAPTLGFHRAQQEVTSGRNATYTLALSDPDGDTVSTTFEVYDPDEGWQVVSTKVVDQQGTWRTDLFDATDEGEITRYRIRYDDGNGNEGVWGPFDGPTVVDDDTTPPSIYGFDYPVNVTVGASPTVEFQVSDRGSAVGSVTVRITLPSGSMRTITPQKSDDGYTVEIPATSEPGEIQFSVTASDADNSPAETTGETRTINVREANERPTAALDSVSTVTVGQSVTLDASDSVESGGDGLTYRWDFDGDGTVDRTTDSPTAAYSYDSAGNYTATVTVVDGDGDTDTAEATVTVTAPEEDDPVVSSFEQASSGDATPAGRMYLFHDGGQHRVTTDHATAGSQAFFTGDATLGEPSAIAVRVNLTDVEAVVVDVYFQRANPSLGNIKVSLDGAGYPNRENNIGGGSMIVAAREQADGSIEGRWVRDLVVNLSEYQGVHEITFWVDGDNAAYWDNIRLRNSSEATDPRRPLSVELNVSGPVEAGTSVLLDASGTTGGAGDQRFEWDFDGDGTVDRTTDSPTVRYTYETFGRFRPTVTVVTDEQRRTTTAEVTVLRGECVADAVAGRDSTIELREMQRAVNAWKERTPGVGKALDASSVRRLVDLWADGSRVTCGGEGR